MKIEDKIYVPHVCSACGVARLILRHDMHDNPVITCIECKSTMKRWEIHKETPYEPFSGTSGHYLTYTQKLREITGSPWQHNSGGTLADIRKKVGRDLVDYPGMPELVLLPSEADAAQQRAEMMDQKHEDLVVTLVTKVRFSNPVRIIRVESLRHSQLTGRIADMKHIAKKEGFALFVVTAYSEETGEEFYWNNMELETKPRMPGYGKETDRKRTAYRNSASGV